MTKKQREIDGKIALAIQLIEEAERTLRILLETATALRQMQLDILRVNETE